MVADSSVNPVADPSANPVLADSGLPYDLPDFAAISDDDFLPAYDVALRAHLTEVAAIADNPEPPTFVNTVAALEASGRQLARANGIFFNLEGADTNPQRAAIAQELAVRLTEHANAIAMNPRLFARIEAVYRAGGPFGELEAPSTGSGSDRVGDPSTGSGSDRGVGEAERRLTERKYRQAVRAGAGLDVAGQAEMREISGRLATLTTEFSQYLLDDTNDSAVGFDDVADLDGLSAGEIAAAERLARERGGDGYLVALELPTSQSTVAKLTDPAARQRVFEASVNRCARGNAHDTRAMILEIVALRARRAELLGYANHAEYVIAEETAPNPDAVADLLGELGAAASVAAAAELARVAEGYGGPLGPADVTFALAQEQRTLLPAAAKTAAGAGVDEFAEYCELDAVLNDGVFAAAGELYGLSFVERPDLPGYHPDVRVWEVVSTRRLTPFVDGSTSERVAPVGEGSISERVAPVGEGSTSEKVGSISEKVGSISETVEGGVGIGLFLGDFYARPSKRGGAWMNTIVDQSAQLGTRPVVVNVANLTKPEPGEPCLLSRDQLETLFHEFGHAIHGLLSSVDYVSQSGTSVPRDFVEFPSQVNEMWALHPDVVARYARHWRTGEPAPAELLAAVRDAGDVESAHSTFEYLAAAALDLAWHRVSAAQIPDDVLAFEERALAEAGLASSSIPPRYRSTYFNHIFGGGYSSAYYSYIWSEILDAETEQWFLAGGGLQRALGRAFAEAVLSRGDSVDPVAAHAGLLGRPARIGPLLRRRGLIAAAEANPADG